jgi:hypothetical protein
MTAATTTQRHGPRKLDWGLVVADIKLASALDANSGTVPPLEDILAVAKKPVR